jgi:hypothetical protein
VIGSWGRRKGFSQFFFVAGRGRIQGRGNTISQA